MKLSEIIEIKQIRNCIFCNHKCEIFQSEKEDNGWKSCLFCCIGCDIDVNMDFLFGNLKYISFCFGIGGGNYISVDRAGIYIVIMHSSPKLLKSYDDIDLSIVKNNVEKYKLLI